MCDEGIETYTICIVGYYKRFYDDWWKNIITDYAQSFGHLLGIEPNYFSFSTELGNKPKTLKYNKTNIEKLLRNDDLKSISIIKKEQVDEYFVDTWFKIMAIRTRNVPYCQVYLNVSPTIFPQKRSIVNKDNQYIKLLLSLGELCYGFINPMERKKWPSLFYLDFETENLSDEEKSELNHWWLNRKLYMAKTRGVFWGNILTNKHLNNDESQSQICQIVGNDNFTKLDDERFMFFLPSEFDEINRDINRSRSYNEVLEVFRSNDIL